MKKLTTALAAGALALGLSACGGSDPGPEQTVKDFHQALKDEDTTAFCDTLAPDLVTSLEKAAGEDLTCPEIMDENAEAFFGQVDQDAEVEIIDTTRDDETGTATVTFTVGDNPEEEMTLEEIDGEWKLNPL